MENDGTQRNLSVYSHKVKAGRKRTYFFDVMKTRGNDYYLTLTESTRRSDGNGYIRHQIFLYKEDFNRFVDGLQDVVNHVKTNLLPDFDYDQFAHRDENHDNPDNPDNHENHDNHGQGDSMRDEDKSKSDQMEW